MTAAPAGSERQPWRTGLGAALTMFCIATPWPALAQGPGSPATVSHSPATIVFSPPTPFDFDAGFVDHAGVDVNIDIQGNRRWRLRVRAEDGNLGGYGKPISDLLVRAEGATGWIPVSTADQEILEGNGSAAIVVYFRLRLSWARDVPDTYGARIVISVD